MNISKFDTDCTKFIGATSDIGKCNIAIYGVPYDGTTSFRPGARFGPKAICEISQQIETYCPQLDMDLNDLYYGDLGLLDIPFGDPIPVIKSVQIATEEIIGNSLKPLMLGGEHSITIGALKGAIKHYEDLVLIQLDAHADLRESWLGSKHNHACTMRRCLDNISSERLLQIGIRSGTREEFHEMYSKKRLVSYKKRQSPQNLCDALLKYKNNPIYLTVDLDWFDPSVLPGTGTPEPGGYFWEDFAEIIEVLKNHRLIGADIVELAPKIDQSEMSSIFAAKVARSILMLLNN